MPAAPKPVECPTCKARLQIPASAAGKTVRCPECREKIAVPAVVAVATPAPNAKPTIPAASRGQIPGTTAPAKEADNPFDFPADHEADADDERPELPYFTAVQSFAFSANRKYRLFVRAKQRELVGVYAGYAADAAMLGVVLADDPGGRRAKKRGAEEGRSLEEVRDAHPFNFSLWMKDVQEAEFVKPSWWFWINNTALTQIAILKLSTPDAEWKFVLESVQDTRKAIELLEPLLGDRLTLGIKWDSGHRRYRKV